MIACLDRSLREHKKPFSILQDKEFQESRKVLNGKAIELREQGKGKTPKKAHALTEEEEHFAMGKERFGFALTKVSEFHHLLPCEPTVWDPWPPRASPNQTGGPQVGETP